MSIIITSVDDQPMTTMDINEFVKPNSVSRYDVVKDTAIARANHCGLAIAQIPILITPIEKIIFNITKMIKRIRGAFNPQAMNKPQVNTMIVNGDLETACIFDFLEMSIPIPAIAAVKVSAANPSSAS